MSDILLVHAVMSAGISMPVIEPVVAGATIKLVAHDRLAALVSVLPAGADQTVFADPQQATELAMRHHAMLTALAVTVDLAPVRLGAVYADETAVVAMLAESASSFADALARIAGAAEFAMKLIPIAVIETPKVHAALTGRGFLQRRADATTAQKNRVELARRIASQVFELVAQNARDHAFAPPRRNAQTDQEKRLLDAALLINRDAIANFERAVVAAQSIAEAEGFGLSVTGPLPAYSFVATGTNRELAA
jgi:hypothetical protein